MRQVRKYFLLQQAGKASALTALLVKTFPVIRDRVLADPRFLFKACAVFCLACLRKRGELADANSLFLDSGLFLPSPSLPPPSLSPLLSVSASAPPLPARSLGRCGWKSASTRGAPPSPRSASAPTPSGLSSRCGSLLSSYFFLLASFFCFLFSVFCRPPPTNSSPDLPPPKSLKNQPKHPTHPAVRRSTTCPTSSWAWCSTPPSSS